MRASEMIMSLKLTSQTKTETETMRNLIYQVSQGGQWSLTLKRRNLRKYVARAMPPMRAIKVYGLKTKGQQKPPTPT